MRITPRLRNESEGDSRLVRLWYEPGRGQYVLAYSDETEPRVADPEEVGELTGRAIHHAHAPAGALPVPLVAQVAATAACNLACAFCYADLKACRTPDLDTPDMVRLIDLLHAQGVIFLEWAGGEPLLRADFVALLRYAHGLDFKQAVLTNGTHVTDEFLEWAPTCLDSIQISVDDVGVHYDALKGGPYWDVLQKNLARSLEARLPVVASIVLSERNAPRLEGTVEWLWTHGVRVVRVSWQVPMGEARDESLAAYRQFVRGMLTRVRRLQRDYRRRGLRVVALQECPAPGQPEFLPREFLLCPAGRSRLYVDWNGDAYPCPVLRYPELCGGNLLRQGFERTWFSPAWDALRAVTNGSQCATCNAYCSYWCRALVYGFTRDLSLTPSPLCPRSRTKRATAPATVLWPIH